MMDVMKDNLVVLYKDVLDMAANNLAEGKPTYIPIVKQKIIVHLDKECTSLEKVYTDSVDLYQFNDKLSLLNENTRTVVNNQYTNDINLILFKALGGSIDSFEKDFKDLIRILKSNEDITNRVEVLNALEYYYKCNRDIYVNVEGVTIKVPHDIVYTYEHTIVDTLEPIDESLTELIEKASPIKLEHPVIYTLVDQYGLEIKFVYGLEIKFVK